MVLLVQAVTGLPLHCSVAAAMWQGQGVYVSRRRSSLLAGLLFCDVLIAEG